MKTMISTITVGLLAAVASGAAIAKPAPAPDPLPSPESNNGTTNVPVGPVNLKKRDLTSLYICSDIQFQGRCQNLDSYRGQCYNLYNGFNDVVSSLGPPIGTTCVYYDDYGCNGGSLTVIYPGIQDLRDFGWNDRGSAYRCT